MCVATPLDADEELWLGYTGGGGGGTFDVVEGSTAVSLIDGFATSHGGFVDGFATSHGGFCDAKAANVR